ncbi:MAG TPA: Gfo/Idh/MocA family oxidoreductase [Phycisphaeraceae bacterium]
MIRLGFVGLGGMGLLQAKTFAAIRGCRVVAGADPSPAAGERFSKEFPHARAYADHRDLLREAEADAVVVAPPTLYHPAPTIDALRRGLPVLVEKPMARTVADARRMLQAARRAKRLLMVAHCRRFDDHWGIFGRMIQEGIIGRPVLWRCVAAGKAPGVWFVDERLGGGPLIDMAVHNYDFANHLFGRPQNVQGRAIKLTRATGIDTGSVLVEYASGDQLLFSWSWGVPGGQVMDALGPRGSVIFGPGDLAPRRLDHARYAYFCQCDLDNQRKLIQRRVDFMRMYTQQAKHFLACVEGKAECQSPAETGLLAVAVAQAALRAAATGRRQAVRV